MAKKKPITKALAKKQDKERLERLAQESKAVRDALFSMQHIYTLHEEICSIRLKYAEEAPTIEEVKQMRLDMLKDTGFFEEDVETLRATMLAQTEVLKQGTGQLIARSVESGRVAHFVSLGKLLLDIISTQAKLFGVDSQSAQSMPEAITVQFEEMPSLD